MAVNGMKGRDTVKSNINGSHSTIGNESGQGHSNNVSAPVSNNSTNVLSTQSSSTETAQNTAQSTTVDTPVQLDVNSSSPTVFTLNVKKDDENGPVTVSGIGLNISNDPRMGQAANDRYKYSKAEAKNEKQINKNVNKEQERLTKIGQTQSEMKDPAKAGAFASRDEAEASLAYRAGYQNKNNNENSPSGTLPAQSLVTKEDSAQNKRKEQRLAAQKAYDEKVKKLGQEFDTQVEEANKSFEDTSNTNNFYNEAIKYVPKDPAYKQLIDEADKRLEELEKQDIIKTTPGLKDDLAAGNLGKLKNYSKALFGGDKKGFEQQNLNEGNFAIGAALHDKKITGAEPLTADEKAVVEEALISPRKYDPKITEAIKILENKGYFDKNDRTSNFSLFNAAADNYKKVQQNTTAVRAEKERAMLEAYANENGYKMNESVDGTLTFSKDGTDITFSKNDDGTYYKSAGMYDGPDRYQTRDEYIKQLAGEKPADFDEETVYEETTAPLDSTTFINEEGDIVSYTPEQRTKRAEIKDRVEDVIDAYNKGQFDRAVELTANMNELVKEAVQEKALTQEEALKIYYSGRQIGADFIRNTYPDVESLSKQEQEDLLEQDPMLKKALSWNSLLDAIQASQVQALYQDYADNKITETQLLEKMYVIAEGGAQKANRLALTAVAEMNTPTFKSFIDYNVKQYNDVKTQLKVIEDGGYFNETSPADKLGNAAGYLMTNSFADAVGSIINAATLGLATGAFDSLKNSNKITAITPTNNVKGFTSLYYTPTGRTFVQVGRLSAGLALIGAGLSSIISGNTIGSIPLIKKGVESVTKDVNGDPINKEMNKIASEYGFTRPYTSSPATITKSGGSSTSGLSENKNNSILKKKKKKDGSDIETEYDEETYEGWNAGRGLSDEEIEELIRQQYNKNGASQAYASSLYR